MGDTRQGDSLVVVSGIKRGTAVDKQMYKTEQSLLSIVISD